MMILKRTIVMCVFFVSWFRCVNVSCFRKIPNSIFHIPLTYLLLSKENTASVHLYEASRTRTKFRSIYTLGRYVFSLRSTMGKDAAAAAAHSN